MFSLSAANFLTSFSNVTLAYYNVLKKLRPGTIRHGEQPQEVHEAYRIAFEEPIERYSITNSHKGGVEEEGAARKKTLARKLLKERYGVNEDEGDKDMDLLWEIFNEDEDSNEAKISKTSYNLYDDQDDLKCSVRKMMNIGMRRLKLMKIPKVLGGLHQISKSGSRKVCYM